MPDLTLEENDEVHRHRLFFFLLFFLQRKENKAFTAGTALVGINVTVHCSYINSAPEWSLHKRDGDDNSKLL